MAQAPKLKIENPVHDFGKIKQGESSIIKVTFNSKGKDGNQSEIILVFSNDPSNPTQKITIKSRVESENIFWYST